MAGRRVKTGAQLASALSDIGDLVEKDLAKDILQILTLDAFRYIVRRSPVRTGFLRSNWTITTATVPPELLSNPHTGEQREMYSPPQEPSVTNIDWGDVVRLYNLTEYASYLDDGTPKMRARPMVVPTQLFTLAEARRLINTYKRKRYE